MARRAAKRVDNVGSSVFELRDINSLSPGDNQRQFFPELEELATQIESNGFWIQTLEIEDSGTIIAGERRWRAAKILNKRYIDSDREPPIKQLPCMVRVLDEKGFFERNTAENMGRVQLRFIEISRIFHRYRERYGLSNEQIGAKCGFSSETVSRYIAILEKCHPQIIQRLDNGDSIPIDLLIKIHTIRDKDVQLLRLNQWLGNPTEASETVSRERRAALSRRKLVTLVKLLQEGSYSQETIQIVQYVAGMRTSLPNKLHLKLSPKRRTRQED